VPPESVDPVGTKIANLWNEFGVGLGKATDKECFFWINSDENFLFRKYFTNSFK
jgi:hypothetical protein